MATSYINFCESLNVKHSVTGIYLFLKVTLIALTTQFSYFQQIYLGHIRTHRFDKQFKQSFSNYNIFALLHIICTVKKLFRMHKKS